MSNNDYLFENKSRKVIEFLAQNKDKSYSQSELARGIALQRFQFNNYLEKMLEDGFVEKKRRDDGVLGSKYQITKQGIRLANLYEQVGEAFDEVRSGRVQSKPKQDSGNLYALVEALERKSPKNEEEFLDMVEKHFSADIRSEVESNLKCGEFDTREDALYDIVIRKSLW